MSLESVPEWHRSLHQAPEHASNTTVHKKKATHSVKSMHHSIESFPLFLTLFSSQLVLLNKPHTHTLKPSPNSAAATGGKSADQTIRLVIKSNYTEMLC